MILKSYLSDYIKVLVDLIEINQITFEIKLSYIPS